MVSNISQSIDPDGQCTGGGGNVLNTPHKSGPFCIKRVHPFLAGCAKSTANIAETQFTSYHVLAEIQLPVSRVKTFEFADS